MSPLIELENVVKFYGPNQALGPMTLAVPEATVGLLGPNGAGKTTLIRILLGLMRPTSGTVRVLGEEVGPNERAVRRRIGYVPEGEAIFPDLTGVEAVAYSGRLVGMSRADALSRAHQVLDYVELDEARYRLAEKYSTGMKQRLKLAQALVHDPALLILDEPTEGVDPEGRAHILDLIHKLDREHGMHIVLSTHILPDVEKLASHALVLDQGRVVAFGTLDELKRTSAKAFLVRVAGPVDSFTERLTAARVKWEPMTPNLRVDSDDPRVILRHAKDAGVVVRHLVPMSLTLEEAFDQAVAAGRSTTATGGETNG